MKILANVCFGDSLFVSCPKNDKDRIRKEQCSIEKISKMKPYEDEFLIFELYKDICRVKNGVVFFQTIRQSLFGCLDKYDVEIRYNYGSDWKIYRRVEKKNGVLNLFKSICIEREDPDLSQWECVMDKDSIGATKGKTKKHEVAERILNKGRFPSPVGADAVRFKSALLYLLENGSHDRGHLSDVMTYWQDYMSNNKYDALRNYDGDNANVQVVEFRGDIEYYGYCDIPDYKKAYEYYKHAMACGNLSAQIKLAKMFKNGQFVKADYGKYKHLVNDAYRKVEKYEEDAYACVPEILIEKAKISFDVGNEEEGINHLVKAKFFIEYPMQYGGGNAFYFEVIDLFYEHIDPFDSELTMGAIFYLIKKPITIFMLINGVGYTIKSFKEENGRHVIDFDGKLYSGRENFLCKAKVGDKDLSEVLFDLDYAEVIQYE